MKTVVIIGASSGIGLACALDLAQRGYRVFATSRTPPPEPAPFEYVPMDVTSDTSVDHAIGLIVERASNIDAVINSAGFVVAGAVEDTSIAEAQRQFDTNFFGVLRVLRATLPHLRRVQGRIINISSIGGQIALPFQGLYCASKFALEGLSESLAQELHGSRVHVSLIEPGDFRTGFTHSRQLAHAAGPDSAYHTQFERTLAIFIADEQRGPAPTEVARVVRRALESTRPRLRYVVGMPAQRWAITLKKIMPWTLFAWVMRKIYQIQRD